MLTQNDLSQIRTIVKDEISNETKDIKKDLVVVKKDLKKIKGQLDTTIGFFDTSWVSHEKRLDRVDAVLQLPKFDPLS